MESLRYYGSLLFNGYTPEWQLAANAAAASGSAAATDAAADASTVAETTTEASASETQE